MIKISLLFLTITLFNLCYAQNLNDLVKKNDESAQQFVERIIPDSSKLIHKVLETNVWDSSGKSIIAFFVNKSDSNEIEEVVGHLYMKQNDVEYLRDVEFGPLQAESGPLEILAVFFANADKDKEKELFVLTKYYTRHYDGTGDFYTTYVFDNPDIYHDQLDNLELSSKFSGCDCSSQHGSESKAKYKTAASIKEKLKSMGY